MTDSLKADRGARLIADSYSRYRTEFAALTRRAPSRFGRHDWHGMQADAVERLGLYGKVISPTVARLTELFNPDVADRDLWSELKDTYHRRIARRPDLELSETFFNSTSRRIFSTVGVDPRVEFVALDSGWEPPEEPLFQHREGSLAAKVQEVLESHDPGAEYEDLSRDTAQAAQAIEAQLVERGGGGHVDELEVVRPLFFRNKGAYIAGRLRQGDRLHPLVLALLNPGGKTVVDAVLLDEDEVSVVFSFTRSYFHVDVENPGGLVAFLKSIMPRKPVAELYTAIGYNKHGKTELYRDLLRHLSESDDRFVLAPGAGGMVMIVFTLPSYDVVFKVIRDAFDFPKTSSRKDVMEKYQLVFRHGRAGRLVDVQEFELLSFPRERFDPELLSQLREKAAATVSVDERSVVIRHLYTERRLVPLNLYLPEAAPRAAREAVLDFGEALRELAGTNIFPGDLLLKNFGVTRHGRVAFYDYDEITFLTDCRFRELPATDDGDEPSFYVGENDIFPEELLPFLGLSGPLRHVFLAAHEDLLGVGFWLGMQARLRSGELFDVYPYPQRRRLHIDSTQRL